MSSLNSVVLERPNHFRTMQALREKERFWDVAIKVGRREFRVHRLVLAAGTDYFRRMFADGINVFDKDVIPIENISEKNMQAFIDFFYTGIIVISRENAESLMKDADFFELNDVKAKCAQYLRYIK